MRTLRVGSRGSELALAQTRAVVSDLMKAVSGLRVEMEIIHTTGDRATDVPLAEIGDPGLFIKEIEEALLEVRIDFAVHSMKDVPTRIPPGLALAATTGRLDPHDVLISRVSRSLDELPPNATLATGSLRRRSQALALRPDLRIVDLRGNVTTRLRKYDHSSWDAVILAGAGLQRLGLSDRAAAPIPSEQILPAVGQGALALEARSDDEEVLRCLRHLDHRETAAAVRAERAYLRRLEGGCQVPIAALALVRGTRLTLEGYIGTTDGLRHRRRRAEAEVAEAVWLGEALAEEILAEGGDQILAAARRSQAGEVGHDSRTNA